MTDVSVIIYVIHNNNTPYQAKLNKKAITMWSILNEKLRVLSLLNIFSQLYPEIEIL